MCAQLKTLVFAQGPVLQSCSKGIKNVLLSTKSGVPVPEWIEKLQSSESA